MVVISSAVEGLVDEAISGRLIQVTGAIAGPVYGKSGKPNLLQRLSGFNEAALHFPWLVLIDLDHDFDCTPAALPEWLPAPAERMCLRVAVPEAEAWLLADRDALADFLGISAAAVPREPESLPDPKSVMVDLGRRSRRREVRADMVPREGSGRQVGPGYTGRMLAYVTEVWRPEVAATSAPSLGKCVAALSELVAACE